MPCSGLMNPYSWSRGLNIHETLHLTPQRALQQCRFPGPGHGPRDQVSEHRESCLAHLPAKQAAWGIPLQVVTGDTLKTALPDASGIPGKPGNHAIVHKEAPGLGSC